MLLTMGYRHKELGYVLDYIERYTVYYQSENLSSLFSCSIFAVTSSTALSKFFHICIKFNICQRFPLCTFAPLALMLPCGAG